MARQDRPWRQSVLNTKGRLILKRRVRSIHESLGANTETPAGEDSIPKGRSECGRESKIRKINVKNQGNGKNGLLVGASSDIFPMKITIG